MIDELTGGTRKPVGVAAMPSRHEEAERVHEGAFGADTELIFMGLSGLTLLIGWLLPKYIEGLPWVSLTTLVSSYVFGGLFTLREAIGSLRGGRFEIDTLMLVAAAGAAALGNWAEGALLLFLFSLGHALEHYAMGRAKRAIEALGELSPPKSLSFGGMAG